LASPVALDLPIGGGCMRYCPSAAMYCLPAGGNTCVREGEAHTKSIQQAGVHSEHLFTFSLLRVELSA
jgi:hypothetical protein